MEQKKGRGRKKVPTIDIFKAWCKGCGICAAFCPKKALGMDEHGAPYVRDPQLCTGCGLCELRCPDFAITVSKQSGKEAVEEEDEKA